MLTEKDQIDQALYEYRRDPGFQKYVDQIVQILVKQEKIPAGTDLKIILAQSTYGTNNILASILLNNFHSSHGMDQYSRARSVSPSRF
jgi:hypothetical protein